MRALGPICPQGAEAGFGGGGANARRISAEQSHLWSDVSGCKVLREWSEAAPKN